jgi:hypothetical protein
LARRRPPSASDANIFFGTLGGTKSQEINKMPINPKDNLNVTIEDLTTDLKKLIEDEIIKFRDKFLLSFRKPD